MQIGDLITTTSIDFESGLQALGIVVETYDSSKGLWYVYWLNGMGEGTTGLCNICTVEVLNASR